MPRPISSTGWMVPISLLVSMTETIVVSGRIIEDVLCIHDAVALDRNNGHLKPFLARQNCMGSSTAWCSIAVVTR